MASIWPRPPTMPKGNFEREGDKLYLAPEVLQGHYGKAADIFGFGMTLLETAANIVVPEGYVLLPSRMTLKSDRHVSSFD